MRRRITSIGYVTVCDTSPDTPPLTSFTTVLGRPSSPPARAHDDSGGGVLMGERFV